MFAAPSGRIHILSCELPRVLRILSKIFPVVEPRIFENLALEPVHSASSRTVLKSGVMHANLFLVKHLLVSLMCIDTVDAWWECNRIYASSLCIHLSFHSLDSSRALSPFDIELRSVERQLDFSDAGKAVSRFLANRNRRLFSMSTENALLTLFARGRVGSGIVGRFQARLGRCLARSERAMT